MRFENLLEGVKNEMITFIIASELLDESGAKDMLDSVFYQDGGWWVKNRDSKWKISPMEQFSASGRSWLLVCPCQTEPFSVKNIKLEFKVSQDQEHVNIVVRAANETIDLGASVNYSLLLLLAKERLQDSQTEQTEHGWIDTEQVLKLLRSDYLDQYHLNVAICRLRQKFMMQDSSGAPRCCDSKAIIERRRGKMRIGIRSENLSITGMSD